MDDVLVITPAWNEAAVIGSTISELQAALPGVDLLVVDDGSEDETSQIAESLGAIVLKLPFNLGVGGAMRTGFEYARRNGYTKAIQVDADGQHDPAEILAVLEGLNQSDIVIGARFADKGSYTVRGPRRWTMRLLAMTLSRLAGTRLTDVTSGFRAANSAAIEQYCLHYPAEYLGDTVDSLVAAVRAGLSVTQVPVAMRNRMAGRASSGPLKSSIYLIRAVFALFVALTRRRDRVSRAIRVDSRLGDA